MSRTAVRCLCLAGLGLALLACATPARAEGKATNAREVRELLAGPVSLDGFMRGTPLNDALAFLTQHTGITFVLDARAYRTELSVEDPGSLPVELPKLTNVRLSLALRLLLEPIDTDYLVQDNLVRVVPKKLVTGTRLLQQPIDATFSRRPLAEALQDLADRSGANIVLDTRAAEPSKAPMTLTVHSAAVENVVLLLADMAGLNAVRVGNTLYVTTPENASELRLEQERRRQPVAPAAR